MDKFIDNVINTWGDAGEIWLAQLPDIIEQAADNWGLKDILAYPNLSYNFVAQAMQGENPVTLKISQDKQLITDEYSALQHFAGNGLVKVLAHDGAINALLLEQARPGGTLQDFETPKIIDKIALYADVVNNIAKVKITTPDKYTHVSTWCEAIDRIDTDIIPEKLAITAKKLKEELLSTSNHEYLCHGDLHLENIIQNDNTWFAIDPKGIIAEKTFEVAAFDLLTDDELEKNVNLTKRIIARNHSLATQLSLNPQRLLNWIFLRLMISAQWFIEDNCDPAKPLQIATQIHPLLK